MLKKLILLGIVLSFCTSLLFAQTATAPSTGDGSSGNPYQIETLENLIWLSENYSVWYLNYIQTKDIDASSLQINHPDFRLHIIGDEITPFTGIYDGQGHIIDNLRVNGFEKAGLFGRLLRSTIKNLGITNAFIMGELGTGCLAGSADRSYILNCYSSGMVIGTKQTGGLIGFNDNTTISNCYSHAHVYSRLDGEDFAGLIGRNKHSNIFNSYSSGSVVGEGGNPGGLIGISEEQCIISNCYWDIQTSGRDISGGGIGRNHYDMRSYYKYENWDFNSIWKMSLVNGYPYFQWQNPPPEGSGYESDPYRIEKIMNLVWINENSDRLGKYYIQTENISASETRTWLDGEGWLPIRNFNGTYDGQGHTIDSIYINRTLDSQSNTYSAGLFDYIAQEAVITNLGVTNVDIKTYANAGALAGISNSSAITLCYSSGSVVSTADSRYPWLDYGGRTGGLLGINAGTLSNCYSKASVNAVYHVGGLVGQNNMTPINNCYSMGSVSGNSTCGGLVGYNYSTVINSFWDIETSGLDTSAGGTGKTSTEMKTASTYIAAGWDFKGENGNGLDDYWDLDLTGNTNNSYPFLTWDRIGTVDTPYEISSLEDLYYLSLNPTRWSSHYIQTVDINASETANWFSNGNGGFYGLSPIGNSTNKFTGSYDGQDHIIDSLFINRNSEDLVGLFGQVAGGLIKNIGLSNVNITGRIYVGGLAGFCLSSTINNSYTTGSVIGYSDVGGLMGKAQCHINNCYSHAKVYGKANCAGLVGAGYWCDITNCYSSGSISGGTTNFGGLLGSNIAATTTNSFWDTQTSGQSISGGGVGGTGKTTLEMKTLSTFTDAGWDFAYETVNGENDIWKIDPNGFRNNGYPYFNWSHGLGGDPVAIDPVFLPKSCSLEQNYPNPFNPRTSIIYHLSADSDVNLSIFDMNGRKVAILINGSKPAGYHSVNWDASQYSSGIYLYRLQAGDFVDTKKMVFMK